MPDEINKTSGEEHESNSTMCNPTTNL